MEHEGRTREIYVSILPKWLPEMSLVDSVNLLPELCPVLQRHIQPLGRGPRLSVIHRHAQRIPAVTENIDLGMGSTDGNLEREPSRRYQ